MSVHTGIETFGDVFREGVCRHGNDRDVDCPWIIQFTDSPCSFKSVHLRHLNIHEDQFLIAFYRVGALVKTNASIFSTLRFDAEHAKHGGNDLPVDVVVFGNEDIHAFKIGIVIFHFDGLDFRSQEAVDRIVEF